MLTQRLMSMRKLPRNTYVITHMKDYFYSTKTEIDPNVVELPELRLSEYKKKMKQRAPFAKNFFRAKFDMEFAAFPEPQTHERHKEFFEWLKSIEDYVKSSIDIGEIDRTGKISSEIIDQLKSLGVFRAAVPDAYSGLGLNYSEYGKLVETLSHIPTLGVYFAKASMPISLISNYGSDEQKNMYLPQIASGQCFPTMCISEDYHGSEGSAILTQARRSDCDKFWVLNGRKTYVMTHDNSNLFIVFAECAEVGQSYAPEDTISAFLVESHANGITIGPPAKTLGFHGLSLCEINFKDTMIPADNIIGEVGTAAQLFEFIFSDGKQNIGAQAIGITKRYLEMLVHHMKKDKDFNAVQFKNDVVQQVVGKICCSIYGMESVLYLTTGILDTVANQDCDIEKCIVESYCVDACIQSVLMGTHILGITSQLEGSGIEQLIRDALGLISIDGTKANMQSVIALLGIQHMKAYVKQDIFQIRNPWANPKIALRRFFSSRKFKALYIADNLHPTLKPTAELIEHGINDLRNAVEELMIRYGSLISEQQMDLKRISEAVSYLYVMAAIVTRASRSYCLGIRDGEKEVKVAQIFGYMCYQKVEELISELNNGNYVNGDCLIREISDSTFEKDAYFLQHPLTRNF